MAIRARVELKGSLTHNGNGRAFTKGSPQILTNPADIRYYEQQAGFSVTILDAPKTKIVDEKENETDEAPPSDNDYNRQELGKMKKPELIEVCEELGLDADGTVAELVSRILDSQ